MKAFALAVLSGVLLALTFPRFNLEFLASGALIPLFFAIQGASPLRASLSGFVSGFVFYLMDMTWVTNTLINYGYLPTLAAWGVLLLLVTLMSFFPALFSYLVNRLGGGNPVSLFLLAPVIWTALEYLRSSHPWYGFSWLGLGYSQFQTLPVIQIAEFTGVYGVTALIVLVNAGVFALIHPEFAAHKQWQKYRIRIGGATAGVFIFCLVYGWLALADAPAPRGSGLKVGLVQGNIAQQMKWNPIYRTAVLERYRELTLKVVQDQPDLVVWPEAVTPFYFQHDAAGARFVMDSVRMANTPLLFGSPHVETRGGQQVFLNSAFYLSRAGEVQGRYDKIHLVPFGEFVPWRSLLFFIDKLVVGIGDFGRGTEATVFQVNNFKFGVSICYEIIFPDLTRQAVKNGAQFLVNITNDAWFGRSAASYQHMAMASLRAVENRVPIVRAANTGISGAVDRFGRIHAATDIFQEAVVSTLIYPRTGEQTYYSRYGDVFSWLCLALSLLLPLGLRRMDAH